MAKVKSYRFSYGVTFEKQGTYHKPHAEIELELSDTDNLQEVVEKAKKFIYDDIEKEVLTILKPN